MLHALLFCIYGYACFASTKSESRCCMKWRRSLLSLILSPDNCACKSWLLGWVQGVNTTHIYICMYCLLLFEVQDFWVITTVSHFCMASIGRPEESMNMANIRKKMVFHREHDCWTMGYWSIPFLDSQTTSVFSALLSSAKKFQKLAWLRSWSMKCWSAIWSRLASAFLQESIAPPPGLSYQLFPGWVGLIQPGFIWWGWECYGIHIVGMGLLWITYILSRSTAEEPRTSWSARTSIARQVGTWTCTAIEDG